MEYREASPLTATERRRGQQRRRGFVAWLQGTSGRRVCMGGGGSHAERGGSAGCAGQLTSRSTYFTSGAASCTSFSRRSTSNPRLSTMPLPCMARNTSNSPTVLMWCRPARMLAGCMRRRYARAISCPSNSMSALNLTTSAPMTVAFTSSTSNTAGSRMSTSTTRAILCSGMERPVSRSRLRWMRNMATAPRRPPTRTDPAASYSGLPVTWLRPMQVAAMPTPTSAAPSSIKTATDMGSELVRTYSLMLIPSARAFSRMALKATRNEMPSTKKDSDSTPSAIGIFSRGVGFRAHKMPWYTLTPAPRQKMPTPLMSAHTYRSDA
mmetsp:Transcript_26000/g.65331  ORF Transcript_26000/g.65331 Transcript_26000/m.65331 type:complete len:323 (-) Transcript_26000:641-1609(-)